MKNALVGLATFTIAYGFGGIAASAHESTVGHTHPHASVFDNALLGLDALTLIALGLVVIAGAGLLLVRRRK